MLDRRNAIEAVEAALRRAPVVVLAGPRQCGKTTLARRFVDPGSVNYFDLESPPSLARLDEPMTALAPLGGVVVIDEVQLRPDLFPVLRVLVDRPDASARFLVLGSASGNLLHQTSESLAGRTERVLLGGFTTREATGTAPDAESTLWRRGGLPRSFLAATEEDSVVWRREYIRTLLERDFPQWGVRVPAAAMGRFWAMLAHYHAQTWNAAEPARALGVSPGVVRRYLDVLTDAMMVRQLQPWFANLKKRQVKAPKTLRSRFRPAPSAARHRHREGAADPSPRRCVLGGLRHRAGAGSRAARRSVLLGNAPGGGDRSDSAPGR